MKRIVVLFSILTIMVLPATALAKNTRYPRDSYGRECSTGEAYSNGYATLRLGLFMPDDDPGLLDDGVAIGGAIGSNFNRNFALEIGLDYTAANLDEGYAYYEYDYVGDAYVTTLGIPVTARFIVPLSQNVDLFAGVGLGLYFSDIEFDDGYNDDNDFDDTSLGYHTLIGTDIKMNPAMALTMELKYTDIDRDPYDASLYGLDSGGTTASVGVRFRF